MSEVILKKKKKEKKEYDYEAVANELIELKTEIELTGNQLQRIEEEYRAVKRKFYSRLYEEYLMCPSFEKLCEKIYVRPGTARRWFTEELGKELRFPEKDTSEYKKEKFETPTASNILIPVEKEDGGIDFQKPPEPEVKVKVETDVDFARYQETHRMIRNIEKLSLVDFKVGKELRRKLIDTLKEASEHLLELIDLLEADSP